VEISQQFDHASSNFTDEIAERTSAETDPFPVPSLFPAVENAEGEGV
jgi:hypothetical protein